MVETKTLTIKLTEVPVGDPEFRFEAYNSPLEPRELFIAGTTWPDLDPPTYDPGEQIKICYKVKNVGDAPGRWTIEVKDLDTGATIQTWYGDLETGYAFKTPITGATLGNMPNRDWKVSVKVTP